MIPNQSIYIGHVMHTRLIPKKRQFRYRVFSLLLNIDGLDESLKKFRLLSFNRFNFLSFYNTDHGPRDGSSLRTWINIELEKHSRPPAEKVFLLSFPRVFGYAFNPFSVYFCYTDNLLKTILYEVKNTFGDQIIYSSKASFEKDGAVRSGQKKEMYVSPFIEMDQFYKFLVRPPMEKVAIRIKQFGKEGETLIASQNGRAYELKDLKMLECLLTHPFMTLKVIVAIHWEALCLFVRGTKFLPYVEFKDTVDK